MTFNASFTFAAEKDIRIAFDWYEAKSLGLGWAFRNEIGLCIEKISNPLIEYQRLNSSVYKIALKRFPYLVYFIKNNTTLTLTVIAVLHKRRHPTEISKRLSG